MPFLDLSQDVVYLICEFLGSADLLSPSVTCTTLHRIVGPRIYSDIDLLWKPHRFPPLFPLLRTLLARPQLGTYVKHVRFQGAGSDPNFPLLDGTAKLRFKARYLVKPIAFIRKTRVPFVDDWIEDLRRGHIDAWVAAVLLHFPNMRTLQINLEFIRKAKFLGLVFQAALADPAMYSLPLFSNLHSVAVRTLYRLDRETRNIAKDVLPFFYLPNVRSITTAMGAMQLVPWPTSPPKPTLLTSLCLTRLDHLGILQQILSATASLESLRCNYYYHRKEWDEGSQVLDLDPFNAALGPALRTLVNLELTCSAHSPTRAMLYGVTPPCDLSVEGSLTILEDFEELRTLVIPLTFLCGFGSRVNSALPPKIEEVTITECLNRERREQWWMWTASPVLSKWPSLRKQLTPQLRKLCLCLASSMGGANGAR